MRRLTVVAVVLAVAGLMSGCALLGMGGNGGVAFDPGSPAPVQFVSHAPVSVVDTWTEGPTDPLFEFRETAALLCLGATEDPDLADHPPVVDQRGPDGAAFLWLGDGSQHLCLLLRNADGSISPVASDTVVDGSMTLVDDASSSGVTVQASRIGAEAGEAGFESRGRHISATVQDGWALAWWPWTDPSEDPTPIVLDGPPSPSSSPAP